MSLEKFRCKNSEREVFHFKDYLCCFGRNDLWVENQGNIRNK
jgi:hypothetical protein